VGQAGVVTALLDAQAEAAVRRRVSGLEAATGVEAVAAVIDRADSYPEIPWKAFALGASAAALAVVAAALRAPGWEAFDAVAQAAVVILAAGAACALASIWIASLARLLLPRTRREAEVLQHAQSMFLESGLSKTSGRDGVLVLVSLFERQVVVVADHGVRGKVPAAELDTVVAAVTARLARGQLGPALLDGLDRLEQVLLGQGFLGRPGAVNEIADSVIQQRRPS